MRHLRVLGPQRAILVLCITAASVYADVWPLQRLFTRPFVWGTRPEQIRWSKQGHTLAFLWNAEGRRFHDLYAWDPARHNLIRLTSLEDLKDPLNRSGAEKDERKKFYLAPPEGLSDYDLSRDGSSAAFSYRGDVWTVKTDGSAPLFRLTHTKTGETSPQFSPDGSKLAYERGGQVYVQDLRNGQLAQVTDLESDEESGGLDAFRWSPDGKRLLYTARAGRPRQLLLPDFTGRLVTARRFTRSLAGDEPVAVRVFVVAADGGEAKQMESETGKAYSVSTPLWSPDSRHILGGFIHEDLKHLQIVVWDAESGKAATVDDESDAAWIEEPDLAWSPDSRRVLFTSDRDGFTHLYAAGLDGGKPVQITRGNWEVSNEFLFGHLPEWVGDWIYYASTEAGTAERQFYRVHPDGNNKERLSKTEGVHTGYVSGDGRYVALLSATPKQPMDLYVSGEPVTRSARPEFAQYPWPEMRFFDFPSKLDGKKVAGKMTLPPGYRLNDRSRRWPAVFFIHGSGYATSILKQWGAYQQERFAFNSYLANQGYVVFDLDYRGSSGYGRDWRTGVYLHMGGPDLEDVLGLMEYARSLGNIDPKRLGIWGSSYGGFLTNMAMFLAPDAFHAGASFSAVNDWENYNAMYTEQRLGKPREYPEAYRRSSPIYFSSMLKNPLLMVHGMVDSNVMFQDVVQLAEKLIQEGKPFEQAYYPAENHIFVRDETLIDAFRRASEFFDRNLK